MTTNERWNAAVALVAQDDAEGLKAFLAEGAATEGRDTLAGLLLVQAIEERASKCFEALLSVPEAVELGGGEALGAAARIGSLEITQRLLDAGVGFAEPSWEPETDSEHASTGSMQSMVPEVVDLLCSAGMVQRSDDGWINEAIAIGLQSKSRRRWECFAILGKALLDEVRSNSHFGLDPTLLSKLGKRLVKAASADDSMRAIGEQLAAQVDRDVALHSELIDLVADGEFDQMLTKLQALPPERRHQLGTEMLPWVACNSGPATSAQPDFGWWALEALIDRGANLDGVDPYGRTALAYVVWRTRGREDLIRQMVEKGADVNAVDVDHNGESRSILDYSRLNADKDAYADLLRGLGAKSAGEMDSDA